ncbi:MAG: hypothetical protein DRQ40_03050 [Gammaproteobacteria bacterium]|nr:MAG: hypothetical protein DRQ40_03050 [Gammaproteobacteria bacterium]
MGWPKDFDSVEDVQAYVNAVTKSKFWKEAGGRQFVHVAPVPDRQWARGWYNKIELPRWAYSKVVILHELAHSLALQHDYHDATHGPAFVFLFRRLIEQELGADERARYDRVAEVNGVKWGVSAAMRRFTR